MPKNIDLNENELMTQKEVANCFRVSQGTIINWRKDGMFTYWRAPGKRRVLYYRDEIIEILDKRSVSKKCGDKPKPEIKRKTPGISTTKKKVWRI